MAFDLYTNQSLPDFSLVNPSSAAFFDSVVIIPNVFSLDV